MVFAAHGVGRAFSDYRMVQVLDSGVLKLYALRWE